MRLPCLVTAVVCDILLLSAPRLVSADTASIQPVWVEPSGDWFDDFDGTWSNFMFAVGSPAQLVYLTVATALSEIWVVGSGGCGPDVPPCKRARGGTFDFESSETWEPLGPWELGVSYNGMESNGDYAMESIALINNVASFTTVVDKALIAAVNDTNFYQGYIGVGATRGNFGGQSFDPLISQLVGTDGGIPSHSYGYTAGAYYRGANGTLASLTLGGYDALRFLPHNTKFILDPRNQLPSVRIRGITAQVSGSDKAPSNWTSTSKELVVMDDDLTALIDTSTPYLWLPTEICDRFAAALNLTWREDLGVYVFADGAQFTQYREDESLSFTFTVSSYDNTDNFGQPLNVPGAVNITVPSAAFAHILRYPYRSAIKHMESGIPYFPLARSSPETNGNQLIIGRSFMQEAYIITNYEKTEFSLHQALFPENSATNYSAQAIQRPLGSPTPPSTAQESGGGLGTPQTVGIVVGAFLFGSILGVSIWWLRRQKKRARERSGDTEENKDGASIDDDLPRSPVRRMFSVIVRRKRSKKPVAQEVHGNSSQPVEVGADAHHQVFEMPVPIEPVELDSHDVGDDMTELGVENSQGLSEYEVTRRKLDRQLQGPVPTYSPTVAENEKSAQDISPVAHYRPPEDPSPTSSPTYANTNSLPDTLPSPLSPHPDWTNRHFDLPSPMTVAPTSQFYQPNNPSNYSPVSPHSPHSPQTFAPSSISRSDSNNVSPTSAVGSIRLPSLTIQRTPIDPTRVICLGPLPENVQLPGPQPSAPRINTQVTGNHDRSSANTPADVSSTGSLRHARSHGSDETLGSNFTMEEEHHRINRGATAAGTVAEQTINTTQPSSNDESDYPGSPLSMERIETGSELVHVPQVADKRYSWEHDDRG